MQERDSGPAQRAADADREAAAEALRAAGGDGRLSVDEMEERLSAVFAARTHSELDSLLADLRGVQQLAQIQAATAPSATAPGNGPHALTHPTGPETQRTVTVMGENRRRGFWRPAADSQVVTVKGQTTIDLTEADLSRPVTHMRVLTLMGSTHLELPEDINVYVTKVTIMAKNDVDVPGTPIPGAPELHIRLISIMGAARLRFRRGQSRRTELHA